MRDDQAKENRDTGGERSQSMFDVHVMKPPTEPWSV
jgi:hypothetical protein